MKYKNELDDFFRQKLQERQPDFSPQAWQEAQQMLGSTGREPRTGILWAWWVAVAAAFLLAAYVFLPGARHPLPAPSAVEALAETAAPTTVQATAAPQLQLAAAAAQAQGAEPAEKKQTAAASSKAAQMPKIGSISAKVPPSVGSMEGRQTATSSAGGHTSAAASTSPSALTQATKDESSGLAETIPQKTTGTEEPKSALTQQWLANTALTTLSAEANKQLPKEAGLVEAAKRPKANPFAFSLIGGLSIGQMNNAEGKQRNVWSPLLGVQVDYTLWRKRGLRIGVGLGALIQSYQNMQHLSLIKRSLYYDFGYSKTTQWVDLQHLSMLSTPLLLHFQAGPHRFSAGPSLLWRLSYAQSVNERKETNFGLVSSSTAMMDQSLEQAGFLSARSINEQSLVSYAPKLQHFAWHLRYELQFAPRWSIGTATTLGATDWLENNIGQDFWMSGQGFLKFHF